MIADPGQPSHSGGTALIDLSTDDGRLARQLLEAAPDAMIVVDSAGRIILANQRAEVLFGHSREALLGRPVEMLMPVRFRERHVGHRQSFACNPQVRPMGRGLDLFGLHKDGVEFPVEIMLSPLEYGGDCLVCAAIRDICERQIDEAERRANRLILLRMMDAQARRLAETSEQLHHAEAMASLGIAAAGLMHDLSNLLLPVRMRLELLRKECGKYGEHVHAIQYATDYMQQLCKRLGAMLGGGNEKPVEHDHTDLHDWWRDTSPLLATILPDNVELKPELADDLPAVAIPCVDLTQAVFNLTHNAGRVMRGRRSATLKIWAAASKDRRAVRLGVTDNGPGMTPLVKERCFEPFFTTRQHDHCGIGLTLVKSILTRAHGSIELETEVGRGTTFTLVLPTTGEAHSRRHPTPRRAEA